MTENPRQKCTETLRDRVLTMELAPGAPVDEVSLASEFGISRTPLREIIQRLAGEGYFSMEPNRGAKVSSLDVATLRHFFQAAPMIYAAISRLAAELATADEVGRLKSVQQKYLRALKDEHPGEISMQNHRFHEAIGEIANTPYLLPSLRRLLIDHTRIGQTFYRSTSASQAERITKAANQHDALIEAIETHDPAKAVEITLDHWALSRNDLEQFVRPDPLAFELEETAHAV